jgi:hypothetical protein
MLCSIDPPRQWKAGQFAFGDGTTKDIYFDCADCQVKEPPIAGCLMFPPYDGFANIAVLERGTFYAPAMFCETCYSRRRGQSVAEGAAP